MTFYYVGQVNLCYEISNLISFEKKLGLDNQLESLILAQNERWRQA